MLARWTVIHARLLRLHFQPEVTIEAELGDLVSAEELRTLKDSSHR